MLVVVRVATTAPVPSRRVTTAPVNPVSVASLIPSPSKSSHTTPLSSFPAGAGAGAARGAGAACGAAAGAAKAGVPAATVGVEYAAAAGASRVMGTSEPAATRQTTATLAALRR